MSVFGPEQFAQKIMVSRETLEKLKTYAELLGKWQQRMNLVSKTTVEGMWQRHFYDSAQLVEYIDLEKNDILDKEGRKLKFLDIGSGAGFPGLVLSILGVGEFHMIESNGKKAAFMNQVIREVGIDAVVHNERVEEMENFPVDYVTSRACASLSKLLELGKNFITEETICLFLKGGIAQQEITEAEKKWHFETEKYTSKTESTGSILRLSKIRALS